MTSSNSPMSRPVMVSIPHRLGREEAKRRLDSGISRVRAELGALVTALDYRWQADTVNFRVEAFWQVISGRMAVLDEAVEIEIDLPGIMRFFAGAAAKQARERTLRMLEKPAR